ncbi:hypothetical protein [Dysgonomonas sp. 511]|uniref:hypothetical protein n=1 Tax=Dysgonomonas sp. 511 TaxID=2302930 RepID=UPI0013CF83A0|nr:hypothetical protein [Dysgonomonas sp. 511]NDV79500.1 hypothetical protein [Dysgonomonas sp. 511]
MITRLLTFGFLLLQSLFLFSQEAKTIHILVALCDNQYQGIVKVPKGIGNGQDPHTNLYWGCGYGIRTYFKKSASWKEVKREKVDDIRLERIVFKHKTKNYYLVADAYDGRFISNCTIDFLKSCAGSMKDTIVINNKSIGINGNAQLVAYIGHNGLMDFNLAETYKNSDGKKRDAIILACYSKRYFAPYLKAAGANPLLWSTHLMSPEAYTIHDAIASYINGASAAAVREAAATAYNKYQKCGIKGARGLLVTGY